MKLQVEKRVSEILKQMETHQLDYYLVVSSDEHLNEYVPEYKQRLKAMTGFSGSAGTVIFCKEGLHPLFVDSRYYLQAEQETNEACFSIEKLGLKGVLRPSEWLQEQLESNPQARIGFDPFLMSPQQHQHFQSTLGAFSEALVPVTPNLVDSVWEERPEAPANPVYFLEEEYTGESVLAKCERVWEKMEAQQSAFLILSKLDEIAWLLNLRGSDIECNPVFESYCVVQPQQIDCFTMLPLEDSETEQLPDFVHFHDYSEYLPFLDQLKPQQSQSIWVDANSTTMGTVLPLDQKELVLKKSENPIVLMKSLKNATEVEQMRRVHEHAACAKIRSFVQLQQALDEGKRVSERDYADMLYEAYSSEEGFVDLSFPTISAFAENSAIVHYSNPSSEKWLEPDQFLLVDSGIQMRGGTTDDTRTLMIGKANERRKHLYTRVLQGHIRLASQCFPEGTTGAPLDGITRSGLWVEGLDYGHGTGHGVGAFLNVHEGPQGISPLSRQALMPGMVVSNEPGYYEDGWGGIRLENLYVVVEKPELPPHPSGRAWLGFDTLTLIPFDPQLIEWELLSIDEQQWLHQYHQRVINTIHPRLDSTSQQWLEAQFKM